MMFSTSFHCLIDLYCEVLLFLALLGRGTCPFIRSSCPRIKLYLFPENRLFFNSKLEYFSRNLRNAQVFIAEQVLKQSNKL